MMRREAFITAALAANTDDCILWPFAVRASSGYGAFGVMLEGRKSSVDAHRAVCARAHGPAFIGEEAAHSCGRKLCINPRHLSWKLPVDNMADAKKHGTLIGGGIHRQRLFAAERAEIAASTESLVTLGGRYGMEPAYLGQVRRAERRG